MANLTWDEAIITILKDAEGAMHYKDIADEIVRRRLRTSVGATPAKTVGARLATWVKSGAASHYQKVGRGEYMLRHYTLQSQNLPTFTNTEHPEDEETEEQQYDVISSFGMFWRRELVNWNDNKKLLGMQQLNAQAVNFYDQIGIYLLYDGREVIYVGRTTNRPLGKRLYEHTTDRLATRWDRFSWFGLLPVSDQGQLGSLPDHYMSDKLVPALEAMLIEALEPRQNRKRGDDLSAVEYLQKEDPEISRAKKAALLEQLRASINNNP